jgi:hypothetical protein
MNGNEAWQHLIHHSVRIPGMPYVLNAPGRLVHAGTTPRPRRPSCHPRSQSTGNAGRRPQPQPQPQQHGVLHRKIHVKYPCGHAPRPSSFPPCPCRSPHRTPNLTPPTPPASTAEASGCRFGRSPSPISGSRTRRACSPPARPRRSDPAAQLSSPLALPHPPLPSPSL